MLGILCGTRLVNAGKMLLWQLIDSSVLDCSGIFVFCDTEGKTRKEIETTKKYQKIKNSMGRRNAICLPGRSCSFSSGTSPSEAASGTATEVQAALSLGDATPHTKWAH